ncbi:GDP-mannose 4,6-dehydratase [SAR202 cluster bacterium AD-812-D07_MRT_10900m]|nr:GDP-mannose 4,6-dehydratase [SAR202 cluster bacterium AD-812-D07_MRT_10900m]
MARKTALITGITGQDGAYLADFLLNKGYEVHGLKRRTSLFNTDRIDHLIHDPQAEGPPFTLHHGDMTDSISILSIVGKVQPDEIYNLAAQSQVAVSFEAPEYTANADGLGVLRMLEAIRTCGLEKKTRFYQASTSELFGESSTTPQSETTPFSPRSPYGVAKLYAHWITINYREAYGLFACNGIMFNHESPIRGETFVSRKITRGLSRVVLGVDSAIHLGNLNSRRDWGHARDYVEMQWMMLQQPEPDDYVIATGVQHTVREFVEQAARDFGIEISWSGSGLDEVGIIDSIRPNQLNADSELKPGDTIIKVDSRYFRPSEISNLLGDATKAREKLGWKVKTSFEELVTEMVTADFQLATRQKALGTTSIKLGRADFIE